LLLFTKQRGLLFFDHQKTRALILCYQKTTKKQGLCFLVTKTQGLCLWSPQTNGLFFGHQKTMTLFFGHQKTVALVFGHQKTMTLFSGQGQHFGQKLCFLDTTKIGFGFL